MPIQTYSVQQTPNRMEDFTPCNQYTCDRCGAKKPKADDELWFVSEIRRMVVCPDCQNQEEKAILTKQLRIALKQVEKGVARHRVAIDLLKERISALETAITQL